MTSSTACTLALAAALALAAPSVRADSGDLQRARAAATQGNGAAALELYTQALSQSDLSAADRRAAYVGRGTVRGSAGDFAGAIRDYESAMRIDPHASDAYYLRALARSDTGDYQGALDDLNYVAPAAAIYPRYYYYRGYIEYELRAYDPAIADFTLSLNSLPDDPEVYYHRGRAYAEKGDRSRAMADFSRTLALKPGDATTLADAYRWHGTEAFALEDYRQARADFDRLLRLDPSDADAAMRRAWLEYAQGDYSAVIVDASRVIHTDAPVEPDTLFPWPGIIDPTACLYDRIVETYDHGIRSLGMDPYALVIRARAHLKLGQKAAALADYRAAVHAIPLGADDSVARELAAASR